MPDLAPERIHAEAQLRAPDPRFDGPAKCAEVQAMSDLDLLSTARQVLIDDRDELAFGQFIDQSKPESPEDKPCHCLAGAAIQGCGLYAVEVPGVPGMVTIPTEYTHAEIDVLARLAPLLEPCFDELLIRAAMEANNCQGHNFADVDETTTWDDLLRPAEADRDGLTPAALVFTYNDYVLHRLGKSAAKAEAIALYDRAITRLQEASA